MDYQMMEDMQRMNGMFDTLYSISPIALYGGIFLIIISIVLFVSKKKKLGATLLTIGSLLTIIGIIINNYLSSVMFG